MLFYLITVLITIGLIAHVAKTGRNTIWIYLFVFTVLKPLVSLICWLAYFIVEIVPEIKESRMAKRAVAGFRKTVDPQRDLRQANQQLAVNDSVDSRRKVADQLFERGRFDEALQHYRAALTGIYSYEPLLMLGAAKSQFSLNQFAEARQTLDDLIVHNPEFKSAEGHLLYARALEAEGNVDKALSEYQALGKYYSGAEATYRHAMLLKRHGQVERGNSILKELVANAELAGAVFRKEQREWIEAAKKEASVD